MIAIHPYTGGKLEWARGKVPVGAKSSVTVSWEKEAGVYHFDYTIPAGKIAHFYIPGSCQVGSRRPWETFDYARRETLPDVNAFNPVLLP